MMSLSFSEILVTCLLLTSLTQGQGKVPVLRYARTACPEGFASYGSYCYSLMTTGESWNTAELLCQDYSSGHLLSLLNKAESSFMATMIIESGVRDQPFWIGLSDINQNGKWKWSNKALYLYKAWENNAPSSNRSNYCAVLTPESGFQKWRNVPCTEKHHYICKFQA